MKGVVTRFTDWTSAVLVFIALTLYVPRTLPVNWLWFDPGPVIVSNAQPGQSPTVGFTRDIKRSVRMSYQVVIRDANGAVVIESRSGQFTYIPGSIIPDSVDLEWWLGQPANLPIGTYLMETCWTAYDRWYVLPPKSVCVVSNVFHITEAQQ